MLRQIEDINEGLNRDMSDREHKGSKNAINIAFFDIS